MPVYVSWFLLFAGPFTVPVDEEVESQHMKFIIAPPSECLRKEASLAKEFSDLSPENDQVCVNVVCR